MKKTLLAILLLCCATGAVAQAAAGAAVLNPEPQKIFMFSHDDKAYQQDLGAEKSLLFTTNNVSGHGVRPLWELAPVKVETPLGDTARMLKKQHENAKKADIVWQN